MKRIASLFLALFLAVGATAGLTGCAETWHGMQDDIEDMGDEVEEM